MASTSNKFLAFFMLSFLTAGSAQVPSKDFYKDTCPDVALIVRDVVKERIDKNKRVGASLLRLCFHDCFINGCDGGLLLDRDLIGNSELSSGPNLNSLLGLDVIDAIKAALKRDNCDPLKVSCADIVVLAAREAVKLLAGPTLAGDLDWDLNLGRKDAKVSDLTQGAQLPGPGSSMSQLIGMFVAKGFAPVDVVTFSGAHSIGDGQCRFFQDSLSEDSVDKNYGEELKRNCMSGGPSSVAALDSGSENTFDTNYFDNVVNKKGLFHSDRELYNSTDSTLPDTVKNQIKDKVNQYKNGDEGRKLFFNDFKKVMKSLSDLPTPIGGIVGEVRITCSKINPSSIPTIPTP